MRDIRKLFDFYKSPITTHMIAEFYGFVVINATTRL